MDKLIFRKFSLDIVNFFLIASFSITFIVWIIQAVNLLDLVSDDGHSLNVYFTYVSLNLPKIFSKTIIFVFFISIFYVINKYNNSNELIVFWNNGIQKIKFINFILQLSFLFLILQLVLNLFIVPKSQNIGRLYLKESNIDFLPKLISEKKFINVVKNLTIFVEEYKKDGKLNKIYINEKIDTKNSKIIVSESGKIIKKDQKYILRLFNGGITNISENNTYTLNFSETDYDLSEFSTKTITRTKVQEADTIELYICLKEIYLQKKISKNEVINNPKNESCHTRTVKSISEELYKRSILPFYTLIIALIASSLVIEPKSKYFFKSHKLNIFLIGILVITISQLSLKFFLNSTNITYLILLLPFIFVLLYYFVLLLFTKFKLDFL
tara:strand:+ start:45 stop:1193 length:1149 start_codon:yes stop_codon:yes gene_type:complete